jgi:hypothetical protein
MAVTIKPCRAIRHLKPHIRVAWLIERAGATQIEAAQLTLRQLHQERVLLQVIAK